MTLGEIQSNESRQNVVAAAQVLVLVLAAIFFLRWFRRAYANVPAISSVEPRWTPGWAVGYRFIPVLGLFRPKQIANKIWESTDPRAGSEHRLVDAWWGVWLLANALTLVGYNLSSGAQDAGDFKTFTEIYLVSDAASARASSRCRSSSRRPCASTSRRSGPPRARTARSSPRGSSARRGHCLQARS